MNTKKKEKHIYYDYAVRGLKIQKNFIKNKTTNTEN